MADPIDIEAVHSAILDGFRAAFPSFQTVDDYGIVTVKRGNGRERLNTPAALLSMEGMEPHADGAESGDGRVCVTLRWELRLVLDKRQAGHERDARRLAADVAVWLQGNRFGLKTSPAEFRAAGPDQFGAEIIHLAPWLVEFDLPCMLGASVWEEGDAAPSHVFVGYEPETGPENVEKYTEVTGDELPAL